MGERVTIHEVGPRDGLQNQPKVLTPAERLAIIGALRKAGLDHIQVAAFVSPKAVPAMAGAGEIMAGLADRDGHHSVLVPNMKGYELALAAGAREIEMVIYGTDGMAEANARMTRDDAEAAASAILDRAAGDDVDIIATISVSFECPFEGTVDPGYIKALAGRMLERGARHVVIADTIGGADPGRVARMARDLVSEHGADRLGFHFHDTRGLGVANVYAALDAGVRRFDSSIAGVGGCPFAPGATGNVATEDVVMLVEQMGFETGVDMRGLLKAASLVRELTGRDTGARARAWLERRWGGTPDGQD